MAYSATVGLAWRMAAAVAKRKQTLIEPGEILDSILSLSYQGSGSASQLVDSKVQVEIDEVLDALKRQGLQVAEITRRLHERMKSAENSVLPGARVSIDGAISRTEPCRRAFDWAEKAAAQESLPEVRLRHLVAGILTLCGDVYPALGIDAALAARLSASLARAAAPPPPAPYAAPPQPSAPKSFAPQPPAPQPLAPQPLAPPRAAPYTPQPPVRPYTPPQPYIPPSAPPARPAAPSPLFTPPAPTPSPVFPPTPGMVPQPAPNSPESALQLDDANDHVVHTIDASVILAPAIEWNEVGPKFAALCELAWQAGATGSVSDLLQSCAEKILAAIPRATNSAILILDPDCGDLLLKAHAPRGVVSVSRSSAQQALDQQKAFIWQRQRDLSQSQFESHIDSGVYAPIVAEGKSFGVLCLNSKSNALRLTAEDLFLAASLGHQIGLVLANRALKAEVADRITVLERLMTNFSPQVRTHLIQRAQAGRLKLGGERSLVSILSADIRGFTIMAAHMDTDSLLAMLNDYFAAMVDCIFRNGGTLDKFIGDALLVVFGSPEHHPRHCEQAAKAAIGLQAAAAAVSERRIAKGEVACEIGIGVHTGEVVHGFIGSPERMEFTIIGDAVNMTARYCAAAGRGEILISPDIYEKLWRDLKVEPTEIATKHEGNLTAYRLLGLRFE